MRKHYHLIGIGGIGMSGIAQLLLRRGITVSGSDIKESKLIEELRDLGAHIRMGHAPSNIDGADLIVYSTAIQEDNPEVREAKKKHIPLIKRAQALAELMRDKTVITVTGSHGKTTTASLVSWMLLEAGLKPSVAIGGILKNIENNAYLGEGNFFVAEADESDGSFLYYQPQYSIITNIDREHLDYYKNFDNELSAFKKFIAKTAGDGCLFCCNDDANLKLLLKDCKFRHVRFGLTHDADIYPDRIDVKGLSSEFDCFYKNKFVDRFLLALGGRHNISNALAIIALGIELGIAPEFIKKTLANFRGARRRIDIKFEDKRYLLIDDYAHHPTEIRATLAAVKGLKSRVIAIFQPHRYTRTKLLLDEFGKCFALADQVVVTDIYPASEPPIEGVTGELVQQEIKKYFPDKEAIYLAKEEIIPYILKTVKPDDLIITLGAGDIVKIGDELAEGFKTKKG